MKPQHFVPAVLAISDFRRGDLSNRLGYLSSAATDRHNGWSNVRADSRHSFPAGSASGIQAWMITCPFRAI